MVFRVLGRPRNEAQGGSAISPRSVLLRAQGQCNGDQDHEYGNCGDDRGHFAEEGKGQQRCTYRFEQARDADRSGGKESHGVVQCAMSQKLGTTAIPRQRTYISHPYPRSGISRENATASVVNAVTTYRGAT